ncbi:MAG: Rieske (2Fe-2S) protein [Bacteroidia bacterium]|nr:Rieske (2Fe-2S) protein [Bacteroidia bacterium]
MNRQQFFTVLGVSAGTVLFAPFLASCSKNSMLPANAGTGGTTSGTLDFTLDLTLPANSTLNTNGGSLISNGIIVARTSAGVFVAVASACTHQGYALAFNPDNQFHCQNPAAGHGSIFGTNGSVINGPAVTALKIYNTSLSGTSLRVFA